MEALAELEIHHSRPFAPTRRIALGPSRLPVDPAPGPGGVLLGGIVAHHRDDARRGPVREPAAAHDAAPGGPAGRPAPDAAPLPGRPPRSHPLAGPAATRTSDVASPSTSTNKGTGLQLHARARCTRPGPWRRRPAGRCMDAIRKGMRWTGAVDRSPVRPPVRPRLRAGVDAGRLRGPGPVGAADPRHPARPNGSRPPLPDRKDDPAPVPRRCSAPPTPTTAAPATMPPSGSTTSPKPAGSCCRDRRSVLAGLLVTPGASADRDNRTLVALDDGLDLPVERITIRSPRRCARCTTSSATDMVDFADRLGVDPPSWSSAAGPSAVACARCWPPAGEPVAGLVLLSYPLHPPGKPDQLRIDHFADIDVPTLFVSGTKDPFATPDELESRRPRPSRARSSHVWLEGSRTRPRRRAGGRGRRRLARPPRLSSGGPGRPSVGERATVVLGVELLELAVGRLRVAGEQEQQRPAGRRHGEDGDARAERPPVGQPAGDDQPDDRPDRRRGSVITTLALVRSAVGNSSGP